MTNAEAIKAFTDILKAGKHDEAARMFNSKNIVSLEAMGGPMAKVEGAAAVKAKSEWWYANNIVHSVVTEGPYVNGNQFALHFAMDITDKSTNKRSQMKEIGLYTVSRGKIVEEKFMY